MIISAVFGTAILAIHGVSGAVMPTDTIKRNEALEVRSEAIEEAHSPIFKREAPASAASATPKFSSMVLPGLSSTTTCVHTGKGFIECGDVMNKRENAAAPSMKSLEMRAEESLPLRDGYPDRALKCDKLNNLYHWAQTSDHPEYCHQLMDKNPPDELWDWCYVLVPCDVPNGAQPHHEPLLHSHGPRSILAKRIGSKDSLMDGTYEASQLKTRKADSTVTQADSTTAAAAALRGCNGKGTAFYFTNDSTKTLCNGELVKGSELYHHYVDPNAVWNTYWMQQCFEFADCPGGAHWGP
ncbi:MAG: hypothetical protein L6R38_002405 [Xanthoria sp. 2 TBL-2021]|nr:MAG: hypothetical protein L6R38_002405 [Xanthoria sp. 2 TBL-2021]